MVIAISTAGSRSAGTTYTRDDPMYLVEGLAAVAHAHALAHDGGGEGLCLPVAATVGYVLTQHAQLGVEAVQGLFSAAGHWWLELKGVRVDPTRHQFDDRHDLLYPVVDDDRYEGQGRFDAAGWSSVRLVQAEVRRAFVYDAAADLWLGPLLEELLDVTGIWLSGQTPARRG